MAETRVAEKERRKRQVKWVGEPQEYGTRGSKLLHFTDDAGGEYTVFSQGLFTHIKEGEELDFDVELRITTKDDKKYENWVVTQIYKDGKPVMEKTAPRRDGGGYRGKLPEETASIERQVAIKEVGECWRAKLLKDNSPEVIVYLAWIADKLSNYGGKNVEKKVKTTEEPQLDEKVSSDKAGQDIPSTTLEQPPMKTKGDFFTACFQRYDLAPTQTCAKLGVERSKITNIEEAWQKIQEIMKEEK